MDHLVASLGGVEASIPDILSGGAFSDINDPKGPLPSNSWTDAVEISSQAGSPTINGANGEHIGGSGSGAGWTIEILGGSAAVKDGQLVFGDGSSHSGHVIITTADHQTHELLNVDKISWHP